MLCPKCNFISTPAETVNGTDFLAHFFSCDNCNSLALSVYYFIPARTDYFRESRKKCPTCKENLFEDKDDKTHLFCPGCFSDSSIIEENIISEENIPKDPLSIITIKLLTNANVVSKV